jgi:hypothetical protein
MADCDKAAEVTHDADDDAQSLVSFIDGERWKRPEIDVMVWTPVQPESRTDPWSRPKQSNNNNKGPSLRSNLLEANAEDCVYDKPTNHQNLDECLINMPGREAKSGERMGFFETVTSKIHSVMGQRLTKRKSSPVEPSKSTKAKEKNSYSSSIRGRVPREEMKEALGKDNTTTHRGHRRRIRHYYQTTLSSESSHTPTASESIQAQVDARDEQPTLHALRERRIERSSAKSPAAAYHIDERQRYWKR